MSNLYHDRPELKTLDYCRDFVRHLKYGQVELWRLLGSNLTLNHWELSKGKTNQNQGWGHFFYLFLVRDFLQLYKHWHLNTKDYSQAFIVEALSDDKKLNGFWLPVAQCLKKDKVVLLTESMSVYTAYADKFDVIVPTKFSVADWLKSRVLILRVLITFLFNNTKDHPLSIQPFNNIAIVNLLVEQINRVIKLQWIAKNVHPKGYLSIYDWYPLGSAACTAFRKYKIPTLTFIHGAVGKQSLIDFTPLNADYIISWGKHNTRTLIEYGNITAKQIIEGGCPRMYPYFDTPTEKENKANKTILILLTSTITDNFKEDIDAIGSTYKNNFDLEVRLHPSMSAKEFKSEFTNTLFTITDSSKETIEESIGRGDIIVVNSSTAGFDAINKDKMVFVLDSAAIPKTQDIMLDACEAEAATFCSSFSVFEAKFNDYLNSADLRHFYQEKRRLFVNDYVAYFGEDAAREIAEKMKQLSNQ